MVERGPRRGAGELKKPMTIYVLAESDSQPFCLGPDIYIVVPDHCVKKVREALSNNEEERGRDSECNHTPTQ